MKSCTVHAVDQRPKRTNGIDLTEVLPIPNDGICDAVDYVTSGKIRLQSGDKREVICPPSEIAVTQ